MAPDARPDGRKERELNDTIFALSSGAPPAAIAIVRISGPQADTALKALAGRLPPPRRASLAELRRGTELLDRAIVLRFPGPASATGEDLVELHLHGGRSVVAGLLEALAAQPGLRAAEAGEFTRRAFERGRIDLSEAEGLSDLLSAETSAQRRAALALAGGALSRQVAGWQARLLACAARVEALLDFSDEDDIAAAPLDLGDLATLQAELDGWLSRPSLERLKDGVRVVIAGPPNAGKSSLLNALVGREAAITSPIAGTTRDLVGAPAALAGMAVLLVDTAGLCDSQDEIERIGVERAEQSMAGADLVLWLGSRDEAPTDLPLLHVQSKIDQDEPDEAADIRVSAATGEGLGRLVERLAAEVRALLPGETETAINDRHRRLLSDCSRFIREAMAVDDPLIVAEALRLARQSLDQITGRAGVEDMLDALFGRFCIGK